MYVSAPSFPLTFLFDCVCGRVLSRLGPRVYTGSCTIPAVTKGMSTPCPYNAVMVVCLCVVA